MYTGSPNLNQFAIQHLSYLQTFLVLPRLCLTNTLKKHSRFTWLSFQSWAPWEAIAPSISHHALGTSEAGRACHACEDVDSK